MTWIKLSADPGQGVTELEASWPELYQGREASGSRVPGKLIKGETDLDQRRGHIGSKEVMRVGEGKGEVDPRGRGL